MPDKNDLVVFEFQGQKVRQVTVDGEPWFVLKDLCDVLGLGSPSSVAKVLRDKEKQVWIDDGSSTAIVDARGIPQDILIVNEFGLYTVILKSRKKEARGMERCTHSSKPTH